MRRVLRFFPLLLLVAVAGCGGGDAPSAFSSIPPGKADEVLAHFNRGIGLMDQYQPEQAVLAFEEVVRIAPDWTAGRLNLGIALLNTQGEGDDVRAEGVFREVIAADPDNPYAHYALGMLLRHFGRLDEARAEFERVLEIDPDDPDAHYQLGTLVIEDDPGGRKGQGAAGSLSQPQGDQRWVRGGDEVWRDGALRVCRARIR
jgi:tetratricopeptide (TPR) repeat protein